ncbi:hypothetical protein H4Q26_015353 [Puccinia striiformis f. sp. tritici PST-130]|nr:hypothetical protein H4Q26_015353 [Puccinia striiformis f. sp. tritici PST-130]
MDDGIINIHLQALAFDVFRLAIYRSGTNGCILILQLLLPSRGGGLCALFDVKTASSSRRKDDSIFKCVQLDGLPEVHRTNSDANLNTPSEGGAIEIDALRNLYVPFGKSRVAWAPETPIDSAFVIKLKGELERIVRSDANLRAFTIKYAGRLSVHARADGIKSDDIA